MTKEQFKEEKNYQASKMCFRQMLEKGIITQEEYKQIGTILLEKYQPILGSLFFGNCLT
ncbi:MAG: hypothetical protein LUH03_10970 [Oscillospiraceae bacterium]|nr:hypothetical protein [Oscillospiraceae bacterium]